MSLLIAFGNRKRWWIRLCEKGGKFHEVPVHHTAEEYLGAYLRSAGVEEEMNRPLFQTTPGKTLTLTGNVINRLEAYKRIKRRAKDAGLLVTTTGTAKAVMSHTSRRDDEAL